MILAEKRTRIITYFLEDLQDFYSCHDVCFSVFVCEVLLDCIYCTRWWDRRLMAAYSHPETQLYLVNASFRLHPGHQEWSSELLLIKNFFLKTYPTFNKFIWDDGRFSFSHLSGQCTPDVYLIFLHFSEGENAFPVRADLSCFQRWTN